MIRVEAVIGNLGDAGGVVLPPGVEVDPVWLSRWDAQKRRLRKRSAGGRDIAIALVRAGALRDGDVLAVDGTVAVVARIEAGEVLVFTIEQDPAVTREEASVRALRLGHVLGNQHWPMRVRHDASDAAGGIEVVVPLSLDRRVVDAVVRAHRLEGFAWHFRPADPGEAELLATVSHEHPDDHAYERRINVPDSGVAVALTEGGHDHGTGWHVHAGSDPRHA